VCGAVTVLLFLQGKCMKGDDPNKKKKKQRSGTAQPLLSEDQAKGGDKFGLLAPAAAKPRSDDGNQDFGSNSSQYNTGYATGFVIRPLIFCVAGKKSSSKDDDGWGSNTSKNDGWKSKSKDNDGGGWGGSSGGW
jgi:hypothetical protein